MNNQNPFDLDNHKAYESWRSYKLENYPEKSEDLIVEINNPRNLSPAEKHAIIDRINKTNMAVYASKEGDNPDKSIPVSLAKQFKLNHLDKNMGADDDGITSLQVQQGQWRKHYIPYTNRPIHWHTDGYYNLNEQQILALNLHCVRPADEGGENAALDHEVAYILLRDKNPDYIDALMRADVMTIPKNIINNKMQRPDRIGPVFSIKNNGHLHMRYTARTHSVIWNKDTTTRKAIAELQNLLTQSNNYVFRLTLQSGWGIISNNVLHDRSGFSNSENQKRLLYRLRYYDSVCPH
jgi:hypothetical protein